MHLRHAAALALVGWYLMIAPQATRFWSREQYYDDSASLDKWQIERSYDNAAICESYRYALRKKGDDAIHRWAQSVTPQIAAEGSKEPTKEERSRYAENDLRSDDPDDQSGILKDLDDSIRMDHARCISSDDPRLKRK